MTEQACGNFVTDLSAYVTGEHLVGYIISVLCGILKYRLKIILKNFPCMNLLYPTIVYVYLCLFNFALCRSLHDE